MSSERIILDENDVISMNPEQSVNNSPTSKVKEIKDEVHKIIQDDLPWFSHSVKCEVLTESSGWLKGKVRFVVEFIPSGEESPILIPKEPSLDELN